MMEYRAGRRSYLVTTFIASLGMEGVEDKFEASFLGREISLETGTAVFVIFIVYTL